MSGARPAGSYPRCQRIRRRAEFLTVQSHGKRVSTPHFVLLLYIREPSAKPEPTRLGIVASRRIGNAVQRNRAKRLIREAFRATRDLWIPGTDLVVIVKKPLPKLKLDNVVDEWRAESRRIEKRSREAQADRERRAAQADARQ